SPVAGLVVVMFGRYQDNDEEQTHDKMLQVLQEW
ncbi:hypothetical protein CDAR_252711, partial [Caerostris darwini]